MRTRRHWPELTLAVGVLAAEVAALVGCAGAHGPEAQVGAYGVVYPGTAANQAQLRAWLDESLTKSVELVGQHLGPGAYWPRAGRIVWHPDTYSLGLARDRARRRLGRAVSYSGWAGWLDEGLAELHVVVGPKGVPSPYGALGHLLEHWHRGDLAHAGPGWPAWDRDYAAWDAALYWQR